MAKRTQKESEQPAKVYQLDAVEQKVDQALLLLDNIDKNTSGLISREQMDNAIGVAVTEIKTHVKSEIEKVHLEYRPLKNGAYWFAGVIVVAVIGIAVATWKAITGVG